MTHDMRMTTEKWMEGKNNPLQFTSSVTKNASGLLHELEYLLIVPRTEQARMDMMLNWGFVYNEEPNKNFFNITKTKTREGIGCNDLRIQTNKGGLIQFNKCFYDAKLIRSINRHYKRVVDAMIFSGGDSINGSATPLRIDTPCGDWAVFIAPRVEEVSEAKTFNPMTGEWE